jgi:hypothetical protein
MFFVIGRGRPIDRYIHKTFFLVHVVVVSKPLVLQSAGHPRLLSSKTRSHQVREHISNKRLDARSKAKASSRTLAKAPTAVPPCVATSTPFKVSATSSLPTNVIDFGFEIVVLVLSNSSMGVVASNAQQRRAHLPSYNSSIKVMNRRARLCPCRFKVGMSSKMTISNCRAMAR